VRHDHLGGALGRGATGIGSRIGREGLGPDPRGVGIEAEDDLRLALGNPRRESVGEALCALQWD
jgi:hypothetical protein